MTGRWSAKAQLPNRADRDTDDIISMGDSGRRSRWRLRVAVAGAAAALLGVGIVHNLPAAHRPSRSHVVAPYFASRHAATALEASGHLTAGPVQLAGLGARAARLLDHRRR